MRIKRLYILFFALIAGVFYIFPQYVDSVIVDDENYETVVDTTDYNAKKQRYIRDLKHVQKDSSVQEVTYFNSKFQEKYNNDEDFDYSKAAGGKTFWKKLKDRIYKFLRILFGWDKNQHIGNATKIAFYIICGIIVLVVLYILVRIIMNHEGKWFFQRKNEVIEIDVNDLEQLIQYADFEKMIAQTEAKGDTRQSIRLYYLWLLRTLKEKKHIEWNQQKTNADYQNEIKSEAVKEKFSYLSYLYNYIWYGEFSISDTDYVNAKNAFLTHLKQNGKNG